MSTEIFIWNESIVWIQWLCGRRCHQQPMCYWHSLASRKIAQGLKVVLRGAVKIINQVCPLQINLLKSITEDLGMDHFHLLLHIEVR